MGSTVTAALAYLQLARQWDLALRTRLMLLVFVGVVPLLAFSLIEVYRDYRAQVAQTSHQELVLARNLAESIDRELQARINVLQVLATSALLRNGDHERFRARAETIGRQQYPGANIVLLREDGQQFMNLAVPAGTPLPARSNLEALQRVFATGQPAVSDMIYGNVLRRLIVTVDVPVKDEGGRVIAVLSMVPPTGFLDELIRHQRNEASWIVSVFDRKHVTVARSHKAESYIGLKAVPSLLSRMLVGPEGILEDTSREGIPVLAVFSRSKSFGWTVFIGVPRAELTAPAVTAALRALGFAGGLLLLGLLFTVVVARRISGPIEALGALATATDRDRTLSSPTTGLRETDRVAVALRAAQDQQWRSERRYRTLFDSNPHPMCVFDLETQHFLEVNEAVTAQYGWSRNELLGMTLADVHPPEERAKLRQTSAERRRDYISARHWRKDGTRFDVETAVRIIDFEGRQAGLAISHDITDLKLTRSRLADAIRAFPGSFRLYDREERLVLANDKHWLPADANFKVSIGDTIEATVRAAADAEADVTSKGRKEAWYHERLAQVRRGQTDAEVQTRDGRWFQLLERRTADGSTISLRLDITARKAIEEQLRQSQKMETLGQLASGVAHDFNNSLAVVMMSVENILDMEQEESEVHASASTALHATQQAAALTKRLLAFSRREERAPVELDVAAVVNDLRKILRSSVSKTIELVVRGASDGRRCVLDRTQLETAVMNMVVNARDAIDGKGSVSVDVNHRTIAEEEAAESPHLRAGSWVVVAVSDDGQGMTEDIRTRIFEPFFTTKEVGKGTGLGLSQIHSLVTQSGGFITVDSTVGVGTRIALHFPAA